MSHLLAVPESIDTEVVHPAVLIKEFIGTDSVIPEAFRDRYLSGIGYHIDKKKQFILITVNDTLLFIDHYQEGIDDCTAMHHHPELRMDLGVEANHFGIKSATPSFQLWDEDTATYFQAFHSLMRADQNNYSFDFNDGANEWGCYNSDNQHLAKDWSSLSFCCGDIVASMMRARYVDPGPFRIVPLNDINDRLSELIE